MTLQELEKETGVCAKSMLELGENIKKDYPATQHLWVYDKSRLSDGSWSFQLALIRPTEVKEVWRPFIKYCEWCLQEGFYPEMVVLDTVSAFDEENGYYWYDRLREDESQVVEVF